MSRGRHKSRIYEGGAAGKKLGCAGNGVGWLEMEWTDLKMFQMASLFVAVATTAKWAPGVTLVAAGGTRKRSAMELRVIKGRSAQHLCYSAVK